MKCTEIYLELANIYAWNTGARTVKYKVSDVLLFTVSMIAYF